MPAEFGPIVDDKSPTLPERVAALTLPQFPPFAIQTLGIDTPALVFILIEKHS